MSLIHPAPVDRRRVDKPLKFIKRAHDAPRDQVDKCIAIRRYVGQVLITSAPLAVTDLLSVFISLLCAIAAIGTTSLAFPIFFSQLLSLLCAAFLVVYALFGLYPGTGLSATAEIRQTSIGTLFVFVGFIGATLFFGNPGVALLLVLACMLSLLLVPLLRSGARTVCSHFSAWGHPALVFAESNAGHAYYDFLKRNPRLGLRPIGIVSDPNRHRRVTDADHEAYLGPPDAAESIATRSGVFWAVLAMPDRPPADIREFIETYATTIPHILIMPYMDSVPIQWHRPCECNEAPTTRITTSLLLPLPRLMKRAIDVVVALAAGLLCLPLVAGIILLIKLTSAGPLFYSQQRITRGGRRFRAWKFRTMVANADDVLQRYLDADPRLREEWQRDHKLKKDPRLTPIGAWLRKTSLDELPQLWNVLLGEMSLVGPRPIVPAEIAKYREFFDLYIKVMPGITGLWQISGRNNTTYDMRVYLDSYYVRHWSPWLDLYILLRTINVVLRADGAY